MRSRLISVSIVGALILSACGGSDSTTTRLRNTAANCFDTAEAQTLAVDTARSNLTTAQSALTAAGDRSTLDSALAAATTDAATLQAQYDAAEAAHRSAMDAYSALREQGYSVSLPAGPDRDTFLAALAAVTGARDAKNNLLLPLNRARQRQSAAQRAVDAWTAGESSVSQGQTALSTAEGTPLCASEEVVAPEPEPEPEPEPVDDATATDDTATDDTATDDTATDDTATDDTATDDTTPGEAVIDDSAGNDSTNGDDDGGDTNAAVEESETVCTITGFDVPRSVQVGDIFDATATATSSDEQENCGNEIVWGRGDTDNSEIVRLTMRNNQATFTLRALESGTVRIFVRDPEGQVRSADVLLLDDVGSEEENVVTCGGLQPEVTWSEDNNGTLLTASSCDDAIGVVLELMNERGDQWFRSTANGNTQLRSVTRGEGPFSYQAWHMCRTPENWYHCGNPTLGTVPSGSPADSSGSGAAAPVDESALPTVPVGLLAPVVVPSAGSAEVPLPPTQIAVDPAVVILVCDRDCVADVAERAGVDVTGAGDDGFIADALVELRIDDGEWGYALGGFIPVDNGLVSAEFRVTPINGEPVTFAADFYGNGAPLRETVSVDASGDVVDSSGQTVARIPVFEVVAEESGTPVLLIVLILLALLVAVLVAAFVMKKQRAKLAKSMDTSDSSSSV